MPRVTHRAGGTGRDGRTRRAVRVARSATAVFGAVAAIMIAAGPAALGAQAQHGRPARQVSVFIESVSPQWATPGHTVTVSGIVQNTTNVPQQGLSVLLRSSAAPLGNRDDLSLYAAGQLSADTPVGIAVALPGVLVPGGTQRWQATLQPDAVGMSAFGVYPLAAQLLGLTGTALSTDRTFLPFWPGRQALSPQRLKIAWIWPLIDQPNQAACPGLLSADLARSLAAQGRLNTLLAAGSSYSASADLTWAIDPALVQNVQAMSGPHSVGGNPGCAGAVRQPASNAARTWLSNLLGAVSGGATPGQQVFLTPYADPDVAALSHDGLDTDLRNAFTLGRSVGSKILHLPAGLDTTAWPVDGLADSGVLGSLAVNGISTVILDSGTMPPSGDIPNYTPSAQTTAASGVGTSLHVLLADHTITHILGSGGATSGPPGATFATGQRFLAETAMIVAEAPALQRSIVVAPPRRWNPAPGLAGDLLSESVRAPWLQPVSAAALAATAHPSGQVARQPPPAHEVSRSELSPAFLGQVRVLDAAIRLQASILVPPDPGYLDEAVAALESSAWRGGGSQARTRQELLSRVRGYLRSRDGKVMIIDSSKITLGGSSGKVPVSITNSLPQAVQVELHVSVPGDGRLSVGTFHNKITIPAGKTITVRVPLHASTVGVTYVNLGLSGPGGQPLPGTTVQLMVQATRFGTLALVIMSAALGVFVLTSAARAFRRARREKAEGGAQKPDQAGAAAATGSVVSDDDTEHHHQPPEDPDEYADARDRASR
jgi:hypothetical protein